MELLHLTTFYQTDVSLCEWWEGKDTLTQAERVAHNKNINISLFVGITVGNRSVRYSKCVG